MRHVVVIFVTLLFTSCATDSTTSSLQTGETPKIAADINKAAIGVSVAPILPTARSGAALGQPGP